MAGQRGRGGGRERGADLRYNMEITLEEAFLGKTAQIEIPVSVTCESCSGTGAKAGTKPKTCSMCGGAGRVRQAQGFFTLERTCPGCQGRGQMIEDPVPPARARGGSRASGACRSIFRRAWKTARAFVSPAKARPVSAAARRAISTFSCRWRRMSSSSAMALICIAACRSRW